MALAKMQVKTLSHLEIGSSLQNGADFLSVCACRIGLNFICF